MLVFSPEILVDNVHWGVAPTWSNLALAVPVAMLAYTGVETVSNLAEEVRDPVRSVPNAYKLVAVAVFAIYFTLPLDRAVGAAGRADRRRADDAARRCRPEEGGYANDPILGSSRTSASRASLLDGAEIYVGVLAATILFIATNAGVIGASRITYSMATYRQLPEVFRRLHPRFKTPWLVARRLRRGRCRSSSSCPGDVNFVGTLYSFGATLSFTVAHASIDPAADAPAAGGGDALPRAAEPADRAASTGRCSRSSAGSRPGSRSLVILVQNPTTRWVGLGWIVARARRSTSSTAAACRAGAADGDRARRRRRTARHSRSSTGGCSCPSSPGQASDEALDVAASLSAERGAQIAAVHVLEVPLDLALATDLSDEEALANRELDEARAIGESYGVARDPAARARPLRRRRDRRGGGAAQQRDHRHRRAAEGPRPA